MNFLLAICVSVNSQFPRNSFDRIFVVGAGKACAQRWRRVCNVYSNRSNLIDRVADTWINVPDNMADTDCRFHLHAARPAGINLPTQRVVEGTNRIIELVEKMTDRDLCICLISGRGIRAVGLSDPSGDIGRQKNCH